MYAKCWILSCLLFITSVGMADTTVLVEAESFENLGGWVIDQQFMDEMGSPFLLSTLL